MREIKFRFLVLHVSDQVEIPLYYSLDQITGGEMEEYLHSGRYSILGRWQFTGLKDKNDREIYEGDIVEFGAGPYRVVYEKGCYYVHTSYDSEFLHVIKESYVEIIGNIYENPELLEVQS